MFDQKHWITGEHENADTAIEDLGFLSAQCHQLLTELGDPDIPGTSQLVSIVKDLRYLIVTGERMEVRRRPRNLKEMQWFLKSRRLGSQRCHG